MCIFDIIFENVGWLNIHGAWYLTVRNIIVLFWPFSVKTSDIYNSMLIVTINVKPRVKLTEDTVPCSMRRLIRVPVEFRKEIAKCIWHNIEIRHPTCLSIIKNTSVDSTSDVQNALHICACNLNTSSGTCIRINRSGKTLLHFRY